MLAPDSKVIWIEIKASNCVHLSLFPELRDLLFVVVQLLVDCFVLLGQVLFVSVHLLHVFLRLWIVRRSGRRSYVKRWWGRRGKILKNQRKNLKKGSKDHFHGALCTCRTSAG